MRGTLDSEIIFNFDIPWVVHVLKQILAPFGGAVHFPEGELYYSYASIIVGLGRDSVVSDSIYDVYSLGVLRGSSCDLSRIIFCVK